MAKNIDLPDDHQGTETEAPPRHIRMSDVISNAAQAAVDGDDDADTRLKGLVLYCLQNGHETAITQAMEKAASPKAADEIKQITRLIAANAFNVKQPGTETDLNVELFVIPVMLALSGSKYPQVPLSITQTDANWLAQSIAAYGLKHPDNEPMLIAPQLWSAGEIHTLEYCRVFELTRAFGDAISNKTAIDPEKALGTTVEPMDLTPGHTRLCLRYLVGAVAHPIREQLSFQKKENEEKLEAWRAAAEEYLGKQFGCSVEVFYPNVLYRGLEIGWFHFNAFKIAVEQAHIFRKQKVVPGEIIAVISLHATESALTQLRIGYSKFTDAGEPELVGGSIWPLAPFDDPADIADFLKGAMERHGLQAVEIVGQPQIDDSDSGDGTPTFLPPSKAFKPDRVTPLPASKHMH